jgi:glutamate dehydrogenase
MAYEKIHLYQELLESDLPEDPYLEHDLERYFPPPLPERYRSQMREHRLRREIVATVVANQLVDRAGITFAFRLQEETGASAAILARSYAVAREVCGMRGFWAEVESLDDRVGTETQLSMLLEGRRLVERSARWLARANARSIDIEALVRRYEAGAQMLWSAIPEVLVDDDRETFAERAEALVAGGAPEALARRVACMPSMLPLFDIVEVAAATGRTPETVMETYFRVVGRLQLGWLRDRVLELPRNNRWQALSRAALRDDLYSLLRVLTQEVLEYGDQRSGAEETIAVWEAAHRDAVHRCLAMLDDIRSARTYDTTTLPVGLREVRNLVRVTSGVHPGGEPLASRLAHPA